MGKVVNKKPVKQKVPEPKPTFLIGFRPYLIIAIAGFALYFHTIGYDYSYLDDHVLIKDNFQKINKAAFIPQAFKEDAFHSVSGKGFYYRPLMTVTFVIDSLLSGSDNLKVFRFMNIIYHLLTSCLLFYLLTQILIDRKLSLFMSLLFCVHPINLQAVAWVPGRNDILVALFSISTFIFFINYLREKKLIYALFSSLMFVMALFSKESAVMLPLICIVYTFITEKRSLPTTLRLMIAWAAIIILFLIIRYHALGNTNGYSLSEQLKFILINLPAIFPYLGKALFPIGLGQYPVLKDMIIPFGLGVMTVILMVILFIKTKKKNNVYFISGILWLMVFLIPGLIVSNDKLPNFSEHRMYLPEAGILIFIAGSDFIKKLKFNSQKVLITISIILLVFVSINIYHSLTYRNKVTFWKSAVSSSPSNAFNINNLGAMYFLEQDMENAEKYFKEAIRVNPSEPLANGNLGLVLFRSGNYIEAEPYCKKETEINPSYANGWFNLGYLYFQTGRYQSGAEMMERNILLNPFNADAYKNLLQYYTMIKNQADIQRISNKALQYGINVSQ